MRMFSQCVLIYILFAALCSHNWTASSAVYVFGVSFFWLFQKGQGKTVGESTIVTLITISGATVVVVYCTQHDKRTSFQLRAEQQEETEAWRRLLKKIPDPLVVRHPNRGLLFLNEDAERILR